MWNMRADFRSVDDEIRAAQRHLMDASCSGVPMGVHIVEAAELQRRIVKAQRAIEDAQQFLRTLAERVERAERVMEFEKGVEENAKDDSWEPFVAELREGDIR